MEKDFEISRIIKKVMDKTGLKYSDLGIIEINEALEDNPELVNNDPYGEGWIIKMESKDLSETEDLLDADSYKDLIGG